ncbi:MAG: CHASE3 domain-containing protein [Actinobacteria bacterium]|nr:CHASE3 domain-containing protein [Actinomycetota bacterium]
MSLARRLLYASVVLALLVAATFGTMIAAVSALREANDREARATEAVTAALRLEKLVLDLETGVRGFVLTEREGFLRPYLDAREQMPAQLREFQAAAAPQAEQQQRARTIVRLIREYRRDHVDLIVAIARENPEFVDVSLLTVEAKVRTDEIRMRFKTFLETESELARASAAGADRRANQAMVLGALGIVASTALIVLFGIHLARSIAGPVRAVASGASRLAGGELSLRLPDAGPGEIGELTRSFNEMAAGLQASHAELERQNAKLRESERLKSELISIVSHELRTPLASVIGFTSLLLQREFDVDARRHYLGIVDAQARRLASLLEDFLDVQKIEAGRLDLTEELVDMASLMDDQRELYARQSPRHSLELDLERPLPVSGDPQRLAQVVGNLLSNAIKYSPDGGRVVIEGARSDDSVRISVRDEGVGIAREQQGRIFTKFFRGEAGASGIGGTGLGLAFSREVVEAHGGRIGFDSTAGQGSTFWLELPALEEGRNGGDRKERT